MAGRGHYAHSAHVAHRVVNTGNDLLVFIGVFHLSAGHDYDIVARKGFAYRVLAKNGKPELVKQD